MTDWGGSTRLDVPPPDCDGWVHVSTGDTTYRDRRRSDGGSSDTVDEALPPDAGRLAVLKRSP